MLSAIISDTVLLRSQTTTQRDIKTANKLAKIAGVNLEEYGKMLLKKGTEINDISDYDLVFQDSKEFPVGNEKIQISQINSYDTKEPLFVFDILDIYNMDSYAIVIGPRKKAVESAYHVEIGEDNVVFLKKVASRKKQLYPDIAHHIIKMQKKELKDSINENKEINKDKEKTEKKEADDESTKDENKKEEIKDKKD